MVEEMTVSKRFIVLEIQDHADVLKECVEYLALSQSDIGLKTISYRDATNILYFVTRDRLDGRLAHKNGNPENVEMIISILWGVPKNKITRWHRESYEVIRGHSLWSGAEWAIDNQLESYIDRGSWTDWTVVKSGTLIALAEGEDHRITEFHKEEKALSTDDEAVVTVNCKNPINYLYNQFKIRYGSNMIALMQHVRDPNVRMDDFYRKVIANFFEDPTPFVISLFVDGMTRVNPQIELGEPAPRINQIVLKMLNIHDLERFHTEVVSKLIIAFGLGWLSHQIRKDESYSLEYYTTTHVMAIYKKRFTSLTEKYEEDLLHALNRGDYLPENERVIAERLYIQRANMVLNLSK